MSEPNGDTELSSFSEANSSPAYYELAQDIDPKPPLLSTVSLHALISQYKEIALHEEECGCFAEAECYWKKAYSTATRFLPDETLTAEIGIYFGLFLGRFLPASRQAVFYLQTGLAIDPELSVFFDAWLSLAKSFAAVEEWQQAKEIVNNAIQRATTIEKIKGAMNCLGRILLMRGRLRRAEKVLRTNLEGCRRMAPPHPEILGEALTLLGAVMLEKEQFPESELLLLEAVSVLQNSSTLIEALRLLAKACEPQNHFEKIDAAFEAAVADMKRNTASSYRIAEVLVAWGDAYLKVSSDNAALYYLLALSEYKVARPKSCYVAKVLQKLITIENEDKRMWAMKLKQSAQIQLADVLLTIPTVSTLMAIGTSEHNAFLAKVETLAKDFSDEMVSGEALIFLFNSANYYWKYTVTVKSYCNTYHNALAAHLAKFASEKYKRKPDMHGYPFSRNIYARARDKMSDLLRAAVAQNSSREFKRVYNLASSYELKLAFNQAEECYSRSLSIATALNPVSCRAALSLLALGRVIALSRSSADWKSKRSDFFLRALTVGLANNPAAAVTLAVYQELLRIYPFRQSESNLQTRCSTALDSQCPPGSSMSLPFFEKLVKNIQMYCQSEYLLLKALVYCEGINFNCPISQQLSAVADPFCSEWYEVGETRGPTRTDRLYAMVEVEIRQPHSILINSLLATHSNRWSARKKELVVIQSVGRETNDKFLISIRALYFVYR